MLLQPLIYWLFNHWAQCKRRNQHFLLTLMMVCCTFIAKPEHLVAALLSSLQIIQLFLSLLSSSTPAGRRGATMQQTPCQPAWGHCDQWISTFTPVRRTNCTLLRLTWQNGKHIPFIIAQEMGTLFVSDGSTKEGASLLSSRRHLAGCNENGASSPKASR